MLAITKSMVLFLSVLLSLSILNSCGSSSVNLPKDQFEPTGVYEGFILSKDERLPARLEIFPLNPNGQFLCKLSYLGDENVEPVGGRGSIFLDSIGFIVAPNSNHPFYVNAKLNPATKTIEGTIQFPDSGEKLELILIYVSPLAEDNES